MHLPEKNLYQFSPYSERVAKDLLCDISGKTRYGICVNFYRAIGRVGGAVGDEVAVRRDKYNTTFRRESWRKSMEKSTDSAFSR